MKLRATMQIRNEAMLAARERLGLSQVSLAEQSGVPIGFLMRCEKLDYPKRQYEEKVCKLALFLQIPEDDIMPMELVGEKIRTKYIQSLKVDPSRLLDADTAYKGRNMLPAADEEMGEYEALNNVRCVLPKILETLSFREREIIKLRFGIGEEFAYNLSEVARIFKVDRQRVQQIEAKAIRKLQHPVRRGKLAKAAGIEEDDNGKKPNRQESL